MKKLAALVLFSGILGSSLLYSQRYFSPIDFLSEPAAKLVCLSHGGAYPNVKHFDKVELGFNLPAFLSEAVEQGLESGKGINPFDPEQINVVAVFSSGDITDTVFGFYYQDFIRDESAIKAVFENCPEAKWTGKVTDYNWRVRFSPPATGEWSVTVFIDVPAISALPYKTERFRFFVDSSEKNKGFLAIGSDGRHFIYSGTHQSFFSLGQDIAWPDGNRFRGAVNPAYPNLVAGGFLDIQDWTMNLADNGGNMIRVVNVPWSYELEWDTVGKYDMARAWELDSLFSTCEMSNVKMLFCLEHGTYTLPAWYEEHLTWEKHPYHRFIPGVQMPEDFLTDSIARKAYKKKLHYFLARWGYSTSLGIVQILSEMEHWTLRGPKVELKDNRDAQRKFLDWHNEMLSYIKEEVSYRPMVTSTSYGAPPRDYAINSFSSPFCDVVCPRHCYFTERHDNLIRWEEVNTANLFEKGIHGLFPKKAALIDEMGFGSLVGDPNDIDACDDVTYHNSLWATSFSGTAGAGLYWWRWGSNEYREQNFPALAAFFSEVDFEKYSFTKPGHWEDASRPSKVQIETFYVTSADAKRSRCMGWVHNASYWWGNISQNCTDRSGKSTLINSKTGDDEDISTPTELNAGTKFEIHDLAGNAEYLLTWYSTRESGGEVNSEKIRTNVFGTAKILWPGKSGDWAYKMERQ